MMTTIRQQRLTGLLFEELNIIIGNELNDPRVSLVHVTNVNVSRDLRHVKVYVNHDDKTISRRNVLAGLKHAVSYMRNEIAHRCSLRTAPELMFYYDDTPEKAARVDELLRQIAAEREARAQQNDQP
jgi:ribosome-binding factor A